MAGVVKRGKGEVLFVVVYIKLEDQIILLIVEQSLLSIFFCVDCCAGNFGIQLVSRIYFWYIGFYQSTKFSC